MYVSEGVLLSDLWSNRSEGGQIGIQLGTAKYTAPYLTILLLAYSTLFDLPRARLFLESLLSAARALAIALQPWL